MHCCTCGKQHVALWCSRQSGFWTLSGHGKIYVCRAYRYFLAVLRDMKKSVTTGHNAGQSPLMKRLGPNGPGPCNTIGTQKVFQHT